MRSRNISKKNQYNNSGGITTIRIGRSIRRRTKNNNDKKIKTDEHSTKKDHATKTQNANHHTQKIETVTHWIHKNKPKKQHMNSHKTESTKTENKRSNNTDMLSVRRKVMMKNHVTRTCT